MLRKIGIGFVSMMATFLGTVLPALAEAAPPAGGDASSVKIALSLAAGFGLSIAAFGGALGQARAVSAAMEGIARNPGARAQMFIPLIIGLALIESLVLYMFVVALILQAKV